jgi:hypothetical protein
MKKTDAGGEVLRGTREHPASHVTPTPRRTDKARRTPAPGCAEECSYGWSAARAVTAAFEPLSVLHPRPRINPALRPQRGRGV